ncbi:hypothetical protein Droror1_Dr00018421 [Drosera rotundifolia]
MLNQFCSAVYVGVSSLEERLSARQCCTFRGSLANLELETGKILWQTTPSQITMASWEGNLYIAPAAVLECQAKQNNQTTKPTHPDQCISPDAHYDSVLAFDMGTGNIEWYRQLGGYDVFYLFARPGGTEGGGTWGAATDGKRIYTNIVNNRRVSFMLAPSTVTTTAGAWVALDANTGQILWSTANPSNDTANAPVTLVNGVLFAGSIVPTGPFYGMDAETGKVIWTYITGATIYGGASSSNGCVYIGHGYTFYAIYHPTWTRGKYLFAFCA